MTHFSEQLIPHARLELLESFQLYLSGSGLGLVILAILGACYSSVTKPQSSRPLFSEQGLGMGRLVHIEQLGPLWNNDHLDLYFLHLPVFVIIIL